MGARPSDYAQNAPYKSYIHVDDFSSAQELAAYLHKLDENDDLYNEYFQWKGTGEMINTKFFCRLCAVLHSEQVSLRRKASQHFECVHSPKCIFLKTKFSYNLVDVFYVRPY